MKLIPLTKGYTTTVDDDDFPILSQWRWHASVGRGGVPYARRKERRNGVQVNVLMHRQIVGLGRDDLRTADHGDGDTLNNRRANLRVASYSQNSANQRKRRPLGRSASLFKGVFLDRRHEKWQSAILVEGRRIHLGYFVDEVAAARAYDTAAASAFGEFARLNFP